MYNTNDKLCTLWENFAIGMDKCILNSEGLHDEWILQAQGPPIWKSINREEWTYMILT